MWPLQYYSIPSIRMQYENFSFTKLSLPCLCPGWHVTDSWPAPVSWPLLLPYSWQHITHCIVLLPSPLPPAFHSSLHYFHLISQPPELLNSWPYLSTSPALRTSRGSAVHCTDRGSCATLLFLSSAHCCTRWLLFTTSPQRRVDIVDNFYFSLNTYNGYLRANIVSQCGDWVSGGQQLVCTGQCTLLQPAHAGYRLLMPEPPHHSTSTLPLLSYCPTLSGHRH